MKYCFNQNNEKVDACEINNKIKSNNYFCEGCLKIDKKTNNESKVSFVNRSKDGKVPHFRHKANFKCDYQKIYNKEEKNLISDFVNNWCEHFNKDEIQKPIKIFDKTYITNLFFKDKKTIINLQYSKINKEDFKEKNKDLSGDYFNNLIWIFYIDNISIYQFVKYNNETYISFSSTCYDYHSIFNISDKIKIYLDYNKDKLIEIINYNYQVDKDILIGKLVNRNEFLNYYKNNLKWKYKTTSFYNKNNFYNLDNLEVLHKEIFFSLFKNSFNKENLFKILIGVYLLKDTKILKQFLENKLKKKNYKIESDILSLIFGMGAEFIRDNGDFFFNISIHFMYKIDNNILNSKYFYEIFLEKENELFRDIDNLSNDILIFNLFENNLFTSDYFNEVYDLIGSYYNNYEIYINDINEKEKLKEDNINRIETKKCIFYEFDEDIYAKIKPNKNYLINKDHMLDIGYNYLFIYISNNICKKTDLFVKNRKKINNIKKMNFNVKLKLNLLGNKDIDKLFNYLNNENKIIICKNISLSVNKLSINLDELIKNCNIDFEKSDLSNFYFDDIFKLYEKNYITNEKYEEVISNINISDLNKSDFLKYMSKIKYINKKNSALIKENNINLDELIKNCNIDFENSDLSCFNKEEICYLFEKNYFSYKKFKNNDKIKSKSPLCNLINLDQIKKKDLIKLFNKKLITFDKFYNYIDDFTCEQIKKIKREIKIDIKNINNIKIEEILELIELEKIKENEDLIKFIKTNINEKLIIKHINLPILKEIDYSGMKFNFNDLLTKYHDEELVEKLNKLYYFDIISMDKIKEISVNINMKYFELFDNKLKKCLIKYKNENNKLFDSLIKKFPEYYPITINYFNFETDKSIISILDILKNKIKKEFILDNRKYLKLKDNFNIDLIYDQENEIIYKKYENNKYISKNYFNESIKPNLDFDKKIFNNNFRKGCDCIFSNKDHILKINCSRCIEIKKYIINCKINNNIIEKCFYKDKKFNSIIEYIYNLENKKINDVIKVYI